MPTGKRSLSYVPLMLFPFPHPEHVPIEAPMRQSPSRQALRDDARNPKRNTRRIWRKQKCLWDGLSGNPSGYRENLKASDGLVRGSCSNTSTFETGREAIQEGDREAARKNCKKDVFFATAGAAGSGYLPNDISL